MKNKNHTINPKILNEMKDAFARQTEKLWKDYIKEAGAILEDADEKVIVLSFRAKLDFTESVPKLTTQIRFAKSFTDEKVDEFDDPNQPSLEYADEKSS